MPRVFESTGKRDGGYLRRFCRLHPHLLPGTRMDVCAFLRVRGLRCSVSRTHGGRTLLNEPLCPSWLRPEHGVQGSLDLNKDTLYFPSS